MSNARDVRQSSDGLGGRMKPINHGTVGGYRAHYRRAEPMCEPCRAAKAAKAAQAKRFREIGLSPNDPRHGTASAYCNYDCRCDPCRAAGSRKNAADRRRRADQIARNEETA